MSSASRVLLLLAVVLAAAWRASAQFTHSYMTDTPSDNTNTFRLADTGDGRVIFAAGASLSRLEPWITSGTFASTVMIADINPGATAGSDPDEFTRVGNFIFFAATDATNGRELWKTNLTTLATTLVKNLRPGPSSSSPNQLIECQGRLVFSANDGVNGEEIWVSDGTDAGTLMLHDIETGPNGNGAYNVYNWSGVIYFAARRGVNDYNLWRTDGTVAGTWMVADIDSISNADYPFGFTASNSQLFFSYDSHLTSYGSELWKTDGTTAGTVLVKAIPGTAYEIGRLIDMNGTLYFVDNILSTGNELWRSDGTEAGTYQVKDINLSGGSGPDYLALYDNALYFVADDGVRGKQIWRSDGTSGGTMMVHEIYNAVGSNAPRPRRLAVAGNKLLFLQDRDGYGTEWWYTDGTPGGLGIAADIRPGTGSGVRDAYPSNAQLVLGNALYFNGDTAATSIELWKLEGLALTAIEQWRQSHFGTTSNSGNAANTLDFDKDGLVNLVEFAFGLDPKSGTSLQLPGGVLSGGSYVIQFSQPAGVSGVSYGAEWSTSMAAGAWTPITDAGTGLQHSFPVSVSGKSRVFVRLKVTVP